MPASLLDNQFVKVTFMKSNDPLQKESDSFLQLVISPDKMEAKIYFHKDYRRQIEYQEIVDLLDKAEIKMGINVPEIKSLIERYNQGEYITQIPAVRGVPPINSVAGRIEILVEESSKIHFDEKGRADYRNVAKFRTVKEGQVLARQLPSQPGKAGINIYGEEVLPPKEIEESLKCGANVVFHPQERVYISTTNGVFTEREDQISVNPILTIKGSTGLVSGNIVYEGSIRVLKNISRGSLVSSLGDLEVGGVIESGDLRVGGSLTVEQGVNTKKEGIIRVKGNFSSTYLENSNITVGGSAFISKSVSASNLIVHENLVMNGKSSGIYGGELTVYGSISTAYIGNEAGTTTKILIGAHNNNSLYYETFLKQLNKVEEEFQKLQQRMLELKTQLSRLRGKPSPSVEMKVRAVYKEYSEKQKGYQKLQSQVADYKQLRHNPKAVQVVIRKGIFPGVIIYYRKHTERIKSEMQKVVLTFSPNREEPSFAPYQE